MVTFRIEELLEKNHKTKYWLCQQMGITHRNLNQIIKGKTSSISFRYLEDLCKYLNCNLVELIDMNITQKDPNE